MSEQLQGTGLEEAAGSTAATTVETVAAGEPTFGTDGAVTLEGVTFPPTESAATPAPEAPVVAEPAATEPVPETASVAPPPTPDPFTPIQLQNGDLELKLATGQTFVAKSERELLAKLAESKQQSEQYIQELKGKPTATPVAATPPAPAPTPAPIDPGTMAVLDLMAPGFGFTTGQQLVDGFKQLQQNQQQFQSVAQEAQLANVAREFFQAAPDFVPTPGNSEKVEAALNQYGLPPTRDNLLLVHNALKGQGIYEAAPTAAQTVNAPTAAPPRTPSGQFAPRPNPLPPSGSAPTTAAAAIPTPEQMMAMPTADMEKFYLSLLQQ